jgi:glycosyltransferase involved in cell wall biosynthesis
LNGSGEHRVLKILHIDPERNWGGGEEQVRGLLTYLSARGHQNDLLAHPNGLLFASCRHLDVRLQPFSVRNDFDVRAAAVVRRLIHAENYDIVHFHTKRAHALSLWLPHRTDLPRYVATRRMDYPERAGWYTNRLYNRKLDGVIAISSVIADLLAQAGVSIDKIHHIPSGVDVARFAACGAEQTGAMRVEAIGAAGVLDARKGHEFLLEAAALLKADGMRLRYQIAGAGPLRRHLEQHAAHLGLQSDVEFLGFIEDMPKFFAHIDLFVMPSLHEGFGVAALEAMAAGKPVVASRVGGLMESVVDGSTGILVAPADAAALARAIVKLVRVPSLAREMGHNGRERVRRHFTMERMTVENESYYYKLLEAVPAAV